MKVECQKRVPGSKPRAMRRAGLIPANIYGHNGAESISLTIPVKTVEKIMKEATVNNTLIEVEVTDIGWKSKSLLREVQTHAWKGYPYHLSFFSVASQTKIKVLVPVKFVGEAIGVKEQGGILETRSTEIAVECAPESIPENIKVDVSALRVGKSLHMKELVLPEGVKAAGEPEQIVVTVLASRLTKIQKEEEKENK